MDSSYTADAKRKKIEMRVLCGLVSAVLVFSTSVHAKDVVWRNPGLWEVALWKVGDDESRAVKVRQCSEAKVEPDILLSIVPGQERCAPLKSTRSARSRVLDTQCLVHNMIVKTRMTMSGDFVKAYSGSFKVQYLPEGPNTPKPASTRFRGVWLGTCEAGMKPGDMVLSNGITVNVLADKKEREAVPLFNFKKPSPLGMESPLKE